MMNIPTFDNRFLDPLNEIFTMLGLEPINFHEAGLKPAAPNFHHTEVPSHPASSAIFPEVSSVHTFLDAAGKRCIKLVFEDGTSSEAVCDDIYQASTKNSILHALLKRAIGKPDENGKYDKMDLHAIVDDVYELAVDSIDAFIDASISSKKSCKPSCPHFSPKDPEPKSKISAAISSAEDPSSEAEDHSSGATHAEKPLNKPSLDIDAIQKTIDALTTELAELLNPSSEAISKKSIAKLSSTSRISSAVSSAAYTRPAKPFSQFSPEEKRAYWRWQKSKSRKA